MGLGKTNMISRRTFFAAFAALIASPALAADHPSVVFMNQVGKDLLHAHRLGTVSAFQRVIQRYADVTGIAEYSLGTYKVGSGERPKYHRGVTTFMSRYFVDQSKNYPVAKYEIGEATVAENKDIFVESKVYMMAGQIYTVVWQVSWIGGKYKIVDAKFLGFSMTYQQRSLFTSYISKHDGDVTQLIAALNR
jgi:phospholipid transport system substrate-binding protein